MLSFRRSTTSVQISYRILELLLQYISTASRKNRCNILKKQYNVIIELYFRHQSTAASKWWCDPQPRLGWVEIVVGFLEGTSYFRRCPHTNSFFPLLAFSCAYSHLPSFPDERQRSPPPLIRLSPFRVRWKCDLDE